MKNSSDRSGPQRFLCLVITLACVLAALMGSSHAGDLQTATHDGVTQRSWLDDPDSALSPQAALDGAWTPFSGTLARGYGRSTTWVRLMIDPAAAGRASIATDHRLVLLIKPGHLDEVAVFRADSPGKPLAVVGDRFVNSNPGRQNGLLHYGVVLEDADTPFELLLRLRSRGNRTLQVEAVRWDAAIEASVMQHGMVFAYVTYSIMVILWAGMAWLARRDMVTALFVSYQFCVLLIALSLFGVLRQLGSHGLASMADTVTLLSVPSGILSAALFNAQMLGELGAGRREVSALRAVSLAPLVGLLLVVLDQAVTGLQLAHASVMVLMPLSTVVAARARPPSTAGVSTSRWRRVYVTGTYAVLTLLMVPQSMRVLGLIEAGLWTAVGYFGYAIAGSLLMGSLLALRGREARLHRRHEELVLAQTRREADAQRARAAEQAELMTMLTHELKTPLAVVSLALGMAGPQSSMHTRALRAVRNMRDVIDRCGQAARVDDEVGRHGAAPDIAPVSLGDILAQSLNTQLDADRVDCSVSPDCPTCLGDPQMVRVIVGNLLENALKYSPAGSRVQASVAPSQVEGRNGVVLRVLNEVGAAGKPDAHQVFEKYYRGERARSRSGSGLGLYLSRQLAFRMGGELTLCEGDDAQVCFELRMPR